MGALLVTSFLCLGYRLADLQWLRHRELADLAARNTDRTIIREPRRGDIRDVRGNQLATSVFVKTICADPSLITPYQREVARAIAPILELNETELARRLQPRLQTNQFGAAITNRYVVLRHKVTIEKWNELVQAMGNLELGVDESSLLRSQRTAFKNLRTKSVFTHPVDDQLRVYPNGSLAAHVLGYTQALNREAIGVDIIDSIGIAGIERSFNEMLTGLRGWREIETDRSRREIVQNRALDMQPRAGCNICLTLDAGVQHIVESELSDAFKKHTPVSVSSVVIRPKTGEILAMATFPNFDPNKVGLLRTNEFQVLRNRVISDMAEPGSTFKIVVVSGALNDHVVSLRDPIDCEHGHFSFAGKVLHDHESYGVLPVEDVVAKSSNIGSAKVGIKMGEKRLYQYIRDYGFGKKTGIPLPGEIGGWTWPVEKWNKLSISRIPMGHEMTATPLQMVMAMSAIANHGVLMRPKLIDRSEDDQGRVLVKYPPYQVRRVISEDAAKTMLVALKKVATKEGTAEKAALEHYTVAGKTGTAQKAINGQYIHGKYFSSFIGFFPADEPELCISVVFDEPKNGYYGGQTAAPVFRRIAERAAAYLKIRPDREISEPPAETAVQTVGRPLAAARPVD